MGTNNKQRRAAKAKKRKQSSSRPSGPTGQVWDLPDEDTMAGEFVAEAIERISDDPPFAAEVARAVLAPGSAFPRARVFAHLCRIEGDLVTGLVGHGWSPRDLSQITVRQLGAGHVPHLVALVTEHTRRFAAVDVSAAWAAELEDAGPALRAETGAVAGLTQALSVAGMLLRLPALRPVLDPPGTTSRETGAEDPTETKLLARVRALLSKAESTEFPEEAEALSAKAQELISRHSLDRLLDATTGPVDEELVIRRIWIDAPYVVPKASLIQAVAHANRSRAIVAESLGFSTLMGLRRDLSAVELLVTSLLVQASAAMVAHGRHVDGSGTSRTKSFRQSFLISYAHRVGERLDTATAQAVNETGRVGELVVVLQDHDQRLDEALAQAFPATTSMSAGVTNQAGWLAGREAADRAQLDPRERLTG